jgi:hypothetical protein
MQRIFAILLLPFLVALLVCPVQAANSTRSSTLARTAVPNDLQIEATIRAKLAKSKIGKDGFRFHVQRGVVTWEGTTNVVQHKGSATRMARAAGAIQVINKIQISASGKTIAAGNLKKAVVQQ